MSAVVIEFPVLFSRFLIVFLVGLILADFSCLEYICLELPSVLNQHARNDSHYTRIIVCGLFN